MVAWGMLSIERLEERDLLAQAIAIIDSGVDYTHPGLAGAYIGGWDFAENDADPFDAGPAGSTGTHTAGIVRSLVPEARIVSLRVFDDFGGSSIEAIADALWWTVDHREAFDVPITTVVVGAAVYNGEVDGESLLRARSGLEALYDRGVFVVAPGGVLQAAWPADEPQVTVAMALDGEAADTDELAYFSHRVPDGLAAPGRRVVSTVPAWLSAEEVAYSGTGPAAAYLAGAGMAVWDVLERTCQPNGPDEVYAVLYETADLIDDPETGAVYRRVNLEAAVAQAWATWDPAEMAVGLFYGGSIFGNEVDPSKVPARPGGAIGFENISGFVDGITGVAIDVPSAGFVEAADVVLSTDLVNWKTGPEPLQTTVWPSPAGPGWERIALAWEAGSIVDTYVAIDVTFAGSIDLGSERFLFGSVAGETGASFGKVHGFGRDAADLQSIAHDLFNVADVSNPNDVNKDGSVDAFDLHAIARAGINLLVLGGP